MAAFTPAGPFRFLLGTHQPAWLSQVENVPLFVSHTRLAAMGIWDMPRAYYTTWACDSGGFTQLQRHGSWGNVPAAKYARRVTHYMSGIGNMLWAAPQDWMCEPAILAGGTWKGQRFAGTGLTVREHQRRTVANLLELRELAPHVPWIPPVQGWTKADYLACCDMYAAAGVDLAAEPLVGLGSVCRREATDEIGEIAEALHGHGLRLHGFGVKIEGLRKYGQYMASADSMAWSKAGTHRPGCAPGHKHEGNCMRWALEWRLRVLAAAREGGALDTVAAGINQEG